MECWKDTSGIHEQYHINKISHTLVWILTYRARCPTNSVPSINWVSRRWPVKFDRAWTDISSNQTRRYTSSFMNIKTVTKLQTHLTMHFKASKGTDIKEQWLLKKTKYIPHTVVCSSNIPYHILSSKMTYTPWPAIIDSYSYSKWTVHDIVELLEVIHTYTCEE